MCCQVSYPLHYFFLQICPCRWALCLAFFWAIGLSGAALDSVEVTIPSEGDGGPLRVDYFFSLDEGASLQSVDVDVLHWDLSEYLDAFAVSHVSARGERLWTRVTSLESTTLHSPEGGEVNNFADFDLGGLSIESGKPLLLRFELVIQSGGDVATQRFYFLHSDSAPRIASMDVRYLPQLASYAPSVVIADAEVGLADLEIALLGTLPGQLLNASGRIDEVNSFLEVYSKQISSADGIEVSSETGISQSVSS